MDENFYWNVFKNTGRVESYLSYKSAQNTNTQNTQNTNDKAPETKTQRGL